MTDTCATCRYYVNGECRLQPYPIRKVDPSFWCGEFTDGTPGSRLPYTSLAVAANSTSTFLFVAKADGTIWISINNGSSWAQVTGP